MKLVATIDSIMLNNVAGACYREAPAQLAQLGNNNLLSMPLRELFCCSSSVFVFAVDVDCSLLLMLLMVVLVFDQSHACSIAGRFDVDWHTR